eukprot:4692848-Karenia_brevis.AAC.1
MQLKHELTSKHYPLKRRLQLLDSTVTATVLYGSAAWVLTKDMESILTRTQRFMLRMVLGSNRRLLQQRVQNTQTSATTTTHQDATLPRQIMEFTFTGSDGDDSSRSHGSDVSSNFSNNSLQDNLGEDGDNQELEPWIDWVRRTTRAVESHLHRLNLTSWVEGARKYKWRWAHRVASMSKDRWAFRLVGEDTPGRDGMRTSSAGWMMMAFWASIGCR